MKYLYVLIKMEIINTNGVMGEKNIEDLNLDILTVISKPMFMDCSLNQIFHVAFIYFCISAYEVKMKCICHCKTRCICNFILHCGHILHSLLKHCIICDFVYFMTKVAKGCTGEYNIFNKCTIFDLEFDILKHN